ncbi:Repetin [Streptomyces sp. NPDC006367]|uniref:Repetin n=1 Tax=unclassified Streptomyces TaxID=2593676 RepID=UPI0033AD2F04
MKRRTTTTALCAALLLTAATTGAAVASGPHRDPSPGEAAALTGTAKLYRSAGDDITFTFDAHLAAENGDDPLEATGTFEFSHHRNGKGAHAKATVDCLLTGGDVAVVTGVITSSDLPGATGKRVGVTVHDRGRHDRLGYSWVASGSPAGTDGLPRCVGSAPFEKVKKGTGDFRVVPWQPKL